MSVKYCVWVEFVDDVFHDVPEWEWKTVAVDIIDDGVTGLLNEVMGVPAAGESPRVTVTMICPIENDDRA